MSWARGIETTHPGGRTRDVVQVTCDEIGCHAWEVVGLHGGNVAAIQKLLVRRGWAWTDVADGAKDFCPTHAKPCGHVDENRPGWACIIRGRHASRGGHYYVKEPTDG